VAPLSIYLDASVVVPLFLIDSFVSRARVFLAATTSVLIVSDFVAAEFASVVGIRLRMKTLTLAEARRAFASFDAWIGAKTTPAATLAVDVQTATGFLRRLDLSLRAPDAINLAIAQRLGAEAATFDGKMAASARKLGIPLAQV
jgi:predicted nucleic acid-binding protein